MSKQRFLVILGLTIAIAGASFATNVSPVDAIRARQSNLKDIGGAFKAIRDQLRLSTPNMPTIKQAAQQIKDLAADQVHWFPKGSGPEAGVKTAAKPEIWTDTKGFADALTKFSIEAPKLSDFAEANDMTGLKAQVATVGQACKACHDKYRVPEE